MAHRALGRPPRGRGRPSRSRSFALRPHAPICKGAAGGASVSDGRRGSRPSVLPSFLPFCGAHSYLVVLPRNRSVTFSPSSSSAQTKPEHVTAAAALLPLAHASVVIIMTGAAAATAAEAGALLARSEWQPVLPDLPEMMISTHILPTVCPPEAT